MPKASAVSVTFSSSPWLRSEKGGVGPSSRMTPDATRGPRTTAKTVSASPSIR